MDTQSPTQTVSQPPLPFARVESDGEPEGGQEAEEKVKTCTKCRQTFPATTEFFSKLPRGLYGLRSRCKPCMKSHARQYARAHAETRNRKIREKRAPAVAERKRVKALNFTTPEKTCSVCRHTLPRTPENFSRNARFPDGLEAQCKRCVHARVSERMRLYAAANVKKLNAQKRNWWKKNPEKVKAQYERKRPWYEENLKKRNQQAYANNRLLKEEVFTAYGHRCVCCGETDSRFLTIEHTERNGAAHRREVGGGGVFVYRFLKKNGYPREGYTLLCGNCNWATRFGDPCPHQEENPIKQNIPTKGKSSAARSTAKLRHETLIAYGHACTCCGEDNARFLTIEHRERPQWNGQRPQSTKGAMLYRSLKRQGWPQDTYTLLCFSCNWVARHNEPCPHKQNANIAT